jgi:hypothetical protein
VFAGAAREAIFSKPEVIRRVNADFIPVALKAGLVNNPPSGDEGALYREIGRSKPAPQGICVVNSAGKVLDWVLMFDDDRSVLAFLDHAAKRFARYPDSRERVPAERYMKYPSAKLELIEDEGAPVTPIVTRHAAGLDCPATPPFPSGTLIARVFGRALDAGGRPVADTVRQEHYIEDRFEVPVAIQEKLTKDLAGALSEWFPIGAELARLLVSHAFLGQLDVNPVGPPGGTGELKQCELRGQRALATGGDSSWIRLEGQSLAEGASTGEGNDGRLWHHRVKLDWRGLIETRGRRITRLLLLARGSEKLSWGNALQAFKDGTDVARLPAGHPIDIATEVRYGVIGEPVSAENSGPEAQAPATGPR